MAISLVVEDVADLWAMERGAVFKGRYHVLGGTLKALGGDVAAVVERRETDLRLQQRYALLLQQQLAKVLAAGTSFIVNFSARRVALFMQRHRHPSHP